VKSIKLDPTIKCSQKLPNKIVQEIGLEINILSNHNITSPPNRVVFLKIILKWGKRAGNDLQEGLTKLD
jgi:hypothetical protein